MFKRFILILIIGVLIMSEILTVKCDREKIYDNEPKNQIGTDTDFLAKYPNCTPLRVIDAHNNANCKYVAKNGLDTNTGDINNPYLTIQKGVDEAISSHRELVTVIRNGYVGDMVFQENIEIIDHLTLQVEANEVATIKDSSGGSISFKQSNHTTRTFYSLVVLSSGRIVGGTNLGIWYSDDNGLNWTVSNKAVSDWHSLVLLIGGRIIVTNDSNLGIWYSDDNGLNWIQSNQNTGYFRGLILSSNGRIIAGSGIAGGSGNGIYYSDDNGLNWTQSNQTIGYFYDFVGLSSDRLITGGESGPGSIRGIYYSDDNGLNWTQSNRTTGWYFCFILLSDNRIISGSYALGIWYSDDNGLNWIQSNQNTGYFYSLIVLLSGRIIAGVGAGTNLGIWYSDDNGLNWIQSNQNTDDFYSLIVLLSGRIIAGEGNNKGIYYSVNIIVNSFDNTDTIELNGFYVDGDNNNVYGSNISTVKWCHYKDMYQGNTFDNNPDIYNNIFENMYNGCISTKGDYQENLFYDIDNNCIEIDNGDEFSLEHNTIHLCKIGLKLVDSISTYTLKNNIFNKCSSFAIYNSQTPDLTVLNSVVNSPVYGIIVDNNTCKQYDPLFVSELDNDYRVKVKEEKIGANYPYFNSPARRLADDGI